MAINRRFFPAWEKQQKAVYEKNGNHVYLVLETNPHYGELIIYFQIGELPKATTVLHKLIPNHYCECTEQDSLCGVRQFENDSITYEFLWKPLGLNLSSVARHTSVEFTLFWKFDEAMTAAKWKRIR